MAYKTDPINRNFARGEIIANGGTHAVGFGLSIAGLVILIIRAAQQGTAWHIVSFTIFGTSMILLYLASTVYHFTPTNLWNATLQRLDHAAIYLLIAGTYTPFLLTKLRGPLGWSVFGVVWGLAIIGLVLKVGFTSRFAKPTVFLYIIMGWLVLIAFNEVARNLGELSLSLLIWGGVLYTAGVAVYLWKKLPYGHAIWHLFVMAGSALHYFSVIHIL